MPFTAMLRCTSGSLAAQDPPVQPALPGRVQGQSVRVSPCLPILGWSCQVEQQLQSLSHPAHCWNRVNGWLNGPPCCLKI